MEFEYIRSMNTNYQRLLLEQQPEERKYQYCMINRGNIKGLLESSLRYIDGKAYLYHNITSKQTISQNFQKTTIDREWMLSFFEELKRLQQELENHLLFGCNILYHPNYIYQENGRNRFYFTYIPYLEESNQFQRLLEFFVEHMEYQDQGLVECIHTMYENYKRNQTDYVEQRVFRDIEMLTGDVTEKPVSEIGTLGYHKVTNQDGSMVVVLKEQTMIVGKSKDKVDLLLNHNTVSRLHGRFVCRQDDVYVEDLNSTNGTFVNGVRLQPYEKRLLVSGDELHFGAYQLTYV